MKRAIVLILVLAFAITTLASSVYGTEFKWRHFGANPYATSREEAIRTRGNAFRILGFPEPVIALCMRATETPGEKVRLIVGDHLSAMISKDGIVHRDVVVAFDKPPVSGDIEYSAPAERWQVFWQGNVYMIFLPGICYNWSVVLPTGRCYIIQFNYQNTQGVEWDAQHRARISVHLAMSENEMETLFNDACFGVRDATGFHKPFRRCDNCDEGEWPPPGLANAVELPEIEPKGRFSFWILDGSGVLSFPKTKFGARDGIYCVNTAQYSVLVHGFEGWKWKAVSKFDVVPAGEILNTLQSGRLNRILSGTQHY